MRFLIIVAISLVILLASAVPGQQPAAKGRGGPAAGNPKAVTPPSPIPLVATPKPARPLDEAPPTPMTATRGLEPDGTVVISLPDGSVKRIHQDGRIEVQHPDGIVEKFGSSAQEVQAPANLPPAPPDSGLGSWLKNRNEQLLQVIQIIVRDDSAIQKYVSSEKDMTQYEVFRRRLDAVARLVKP